MTALAAARAALDRITAYDAVQPQAWIARFAEDEVLAAAANVDRRLDAGESLPLAGLTFAVKDNIDLAGLSTTAAVAGGTTGIAAAGVKGVTDVPLAHLLHPPPIRPRAQATPAWSSATTPSG